MAKIYGLFGSMQGKVADVVMAVRNGEQIVRKYQPIVSDPKSAAQVAVRAKLKLMSQLSAVMAPVIAIPRQGAVSSRNLFTKTNYVLASYADNNADIAITDVQLTKSVVGLPAISASREGSDVMVELFRSDTDISRMIYAVFVKDNNNRLRLINSVVVNEAGGANTYPTTIGVQTSLPVIVLAYGVRDNTDAARAYFSNLTVTAENVARVVTTRQLTEADLTLTETRGLLVAAPEASVSSSNDSRKKTTGK